MVHILLPGASAKKVTDELRKGLSDDINEETRIEAHRVLQFILGNRTVGIVDRSTLEDPFVRRAFLADGTVMRTLRREVNRLPRGRSQETLRGRIKKISRWAVWAIKA